MGSRTSHPESRAYEQEAKEALARHRLFAGFRDHLERGADGVDLDLGALEAAPEPLAVGPELAANVVRSPVRHSLPRTRIVSPKVARLMHAPRPPALERSGVVRVGVAHIHSFPDESVDEIDVEINSPRVTRLL